MTTDISEKNIFCEDFILARSLAYDGRYLQAERQRPCVSVDTLKAGGTCRENCYEITEKELFIFNTINWHPMWDQQLVKMAGEELEEENDKLENCLQSEL